MFVRYAVMFRQVREPHKPKTASRQCACTDVRRVWATAGGRGQGTRELLSLSSSGGEGRGEEAVSSLGTRYLAGPQILFLLSRLANGGYTWVVSDDMTQSSRRPLRRAICGACKANNWIPGDAPPLETVPCSKCGHPVIVPFQLRQFELREIIASGGMGTVYRSFDVMLEREVAVKLLKREVADDKQVVESFYREARAGAALNHTNIIHIYTFDEFEHRPYLVMELADHGSLDNRIETEGFLPELDVLDIGVKVASALQTALKHNLMHRDIKPGNILFNADGEPKVVDFGLARKAEDEHEYEAAVWGTPYYVAPEKIQRHGEDFLSDMYSLGGTLYHALTGHVPFEAETIEQVVSGHVHTPLTPPMQVNPAITEPTNEAICIMLAKKPDERYPAYDDVVMALTASRSQLLVQKYRAQEHSGSGTHHGRSWWRR